MSSSLTLTGTLQRTHRLEREHGGLVRKTRQVYYNSCLSFVPFSFMKIIITVFMLFSWVESCVFFLILLILMLNLKITDDVKVSCMFPVYGLV